MEFYPTGEGDVVALVKELQLLVRDLTVFRVAFEAPLVRECSNVGWVNL